MQCHKQHPDFNSTFNFSMWTTSVGHDVYRGESTSQDPRFGGMGMHCVKARDSFVANEFKLGVVVLGWNREQVYLLSISWMGFSKGSGHEAACCWGRDLELVTRGFTRRSEVVMLLLLACSAPVSLMTTIWKKWSTWYVCRHGRYHWVDRLGVLGRRKGATKFLLIYDMISKLCAHKTACSHHTTNDMPTSCSGSGPSTYSSSAAFITCLLKGESEGLIGINQLECISYLEYIGSSISNMSNSWLH